MRTILTWLCGFIVAHPRLLRALLWKAYKTSYTHLPGYMDRYWLVKRRWWLPFFVRFHFIRRADRDRHLHDHPFEFYSLILKGGYIETLGIEDSGYAGFVHLPGSVNRGGHRMYHRINQVFGDGALTLVIGWRMRKDSQGRHDWGFKTGRQEHVNHEKYFNIHGYNQK